MFKDKAKEYLKSGLNPVPISKGGKIPIRKNWGSDISDDIDNYPFEEIGICTGAVSGGLEGIDIDLKNSDDPDTLWLEWKKSVPVDILKKLVLCSTVLGGYHLLYRTNIVEGNQKLAKGKDKRVLIETRGEGGYLKCYPSEGYKVLYGDLCDIKKITDEERDILISCSKSFDESDDKNDKKIKSDKEYVDPFPTYNSDPDIGIELLLKHGWTICSENDTWVEFTRPGKTEGISAGYNLKDNFLYVFTTSTELESEKPYSNSSLFCELECGGNYNKGYRKLISLGYKKTSDSEHEDEDLDDLSFISKDGEDEEKLLQAIEGTIPLGLSYGWEALDEYIVFKKNTLNFILAFEGVGKTIAELHKFVALSVLYNMKFAVACGENEVSSVKRILIEAVSGKDISYFKDNMKEYKKYKTFIMSHFFIFKNEIHYSVEDILDRGKILKDKFDIDGIFIDPFSYFKRPLDNSYSYNDDLLSKLNIYSKKVCSVFMSVHPITDATRAPRDAEGYLKPPTQYDAIGGNIFANRCDSFLVYHRIRNHRIPEMRRVMELRQYKVKEEKTGGSVTPVDVSISLTLKTVDGFTGYFDNYGNNPMYNMYKKTFKEKDLPKMEPSADLF